MNDIPTQDALFVAMAAATERTEPGSVTFQVESAGLPPGAFAQARRNIRHHRAYMAIIETRRDEGGHDLRPQDIPTLQHIIALLDEVAEGEGP